MTAAAMPEAMPKPVFPPPTSHKLIGRGRWNPWKALIEDHPDYRVVTNRELPPGLMGLTSFKTKTIWLCSKLATVEADATLAHELVHVERAPMPTDYSAAIAEERIICEITARRLIPFRDLAHFMVWWPNSSTANYLSSLLHVDTPTVHERLLTLTPNERAALAALRGGPLHTVPEQGLWDDPDHPHPIPGLRAARRRCGTCDTAEKP